MKLLIPFLVSLNVVFATCIHEREVYGANIAELEKSYSVFIEEDGKYFSSDKLSIIPTQRYHVQLNQKSELSKQKNNGDFSAYNRKYIEYYTYPRLVNYLKEIKSKVHAINYQFEKVGSSLAGRDLIYLGPEVIDPNKKTIVMFGRHHGDEHTANWIIEGFLNEYLSRGMNNEFQLILYPMINPDGAMKQTRYNLNNRDLNRAWTNQSGKDEIVSIHAHLKNKIKNLKNIVIALDMHGSWDEDFFYRVERSYRGRSFYNMQSEFINQLARYDSWQAGNIIHSNGHPGMARIVLINHYNLNALTHETIKNIPLRNNRGRSKGDLVLQGEAIVDAITDIY